jgi:hypothetical protein
VLKSHLRRRRFLQILLESPRKSLSKICTGSILSTGIRTSLLNETRLISAKDVSDLGDMDAKDLGKRTRQLFTGLLRA